MTAPDLALAGLLEAALPPPWEHGYDSLGYPCNVYTKGAQRAGYPLPIALVGGSGTAGYRGEHAALIAAAVNALPALLATARRERRLREALRRAQEELRGDIDQQAIEAATGVVIPAIDRALAHIDAALAEEGQDVE
jgi:hypothetical protein